MSYSKIPDVETFKADSSVLLAFRSSDSTILQIDRMLTEYATAQTNAKQDLMYYLFLATRYWLKTAGGAPKNAAPTGYIPPVDKNLLPASGKSSANVGRKNAVRDLRDILEVELTKAHSIGPKDDLDEALGHAYECPNHGVVGDNHWFIAHPPDQDMTVYLTNAGLRRRYKLRFRSGLAYRWASARSQNAGYVKFDTNDNKESEVPDKLCHFAMDKNGRIYTGFDKEAVWFKHSSLLGGEDGLAAGRMRVTDGKVVFVTNDSGHYQPNYRHMVNLLQRLSIYGQDLTHATVQRISDKATFSAIQVINKLTSWPDGQTGH